MLVFPHCKINLGLHILAKRPDQYHDLETVFLPLSLHDMLEIAETGNNDKPVFECSMSGLPVQMRVEDNLCRKAYDVVKKDFPKLPSLKMHLHKSIPAGAGLGGGSADAAFMLRLLNEKFDLHIPPEKLDAYALNLGSDCPFFLQDKACLATSRGERLQPCPIHLSHYFFVLIYPGISISTAWAFAQIKPQTNRPSIKEIIQQPVSTWRDQLQNDFEEPVSKKFPAIKEVKDALYAAGAVYAAMSGSGSSVFGIFEAKPVLPVFPTSYLIFKHLTQLQPSTQERNRFLKN